MNLIVLNFYGKLNLNGKQPEKSIHSIYGKKKSKSNRTIENLNVKTLKMPCVLS